MNKETRDRIVDQMENEIRIKTRTEVPKHTDIRISDDLRKTSSQTDGCVREIIERIVRGESLKSICSDKHMPQLATVYRWIQYDPDFRALYDRASQMRLNALAEQLLDIADDDSKDTIESVSKNGSVYKRQNAVAVSRADLRLKTRMWMLERLDKERLSAMKNEPQNFSIQVNLPDNGRPVIDIEDSNE